MDRGILVGCDAAQEWLLEWWWERYCEQNSLPVAFADFGMSERGKKWCRARGEVLSVAADRLNVASQTEVESVILKKWEQYVSPFWNSRGAWFKKPFAFLQTPFEQTVWLDLDCEVLGSLDPVYGYIDSNSKMGMVRVGDLEGVEGGDLYNSGVVVFEKSSELLPQWVDSALSQNHRFVSDQEALSHLIFEGGYRIGELPEIYNWRVIRGVHLGAIVVHWASEWGKEYIRKYGGLKKEIERVLRMGH